ncbi:MAG: hypothetical protein ACO3Z6_10470 [Pseudomonadales bacterium]
MMSHLPSRFAGVAIVLMVIALWDPATEDVARRVGLPALIALGAALMVRNVAAVAFAAAVLAGIHSHPGSADPVTGIAWPLATVIAVTAIVMIWIRRFRERIKATHAERWRHRNPSRETQRNG